MRKTTSPKALSQKSEESAFAARRKKLLKLLRGDVAVILSGDEAVRSRDTHYSHRPNSNFFYLTGFQEPNAALILSGKGSGPRSVLFLRDRDANTERWTGERLGIRRAKRRFAVDEVRDWKDLKRSLVEFFQGANVVHAELGVDPSIDPLLTDFLHSSINPRLGMPVGFRDLRVFLSEMRFVKERIEIAKLRHASSITAHSMIELFPRLKTLKTEIETAKVLEGLFAKYGAPEVAFNTIVASGKNATCLHHEPTPHQLWRNELVLIDAGAAFRGYAGDITRTVPAAGKFSPAQAAIYDLVNAAVEAALLRAKVESTMDQIHDAAARTITRGLVDLKILKGDAAEHFAKGSYKRFFMHRTGHWLGLDVHDIAPVYRPGETQQSHSYGRPFVPGCVFTVEPGLYFDANDSSVPKNYRGIGIRIEEDVVITDSGHEVLSSTVPRKREELELILAS